jgi:hypothetical protein
LDFGVATGRKNPKSEIYTAVALKTGQRIRPTREGNSGFQTELSINAKIKTNGLPELYWQKLRQTVRVGPYYISICPDFYPHSVLSKKTVRSKSTSTGGPSQGQERPGLCVGC